MSSNTQSPSNRHRPLQARSRAKVERILETSAALLDEVGLEGFNTNLLAERAGVGMQAIYRYFPNKTSILLALLEGVRNAEREWVGDLTLLSEGGDWRGAVRTTILNYYERAAERPGFAALRNAARASVDMQAADSELSALLENELAQGLKQMGVELEPEKMALVCRNVMEASTRILDIALGEPTHRAIDTIHELTTMIIAYLERYVPDH